MVILDGCEGSVAQEVECVRLVLDVFVDANGHVSQERWLGAAQVVGAVGVQDLAVVPDAEAEVPHHRLAKIRATVDQ